MKSLNKYLKQIIISGVILGIFASAIFGVIKYKENKEEEKDKEKFTIELKQKKKEQEYKLTLTQTTDTINSVYTKSKPMADLMGNLWHDNCFGKIFQHELTLKYSVYGDSVDKLFEDIGMGRLIPFIPQGDLSSVYRLVLDYETENGTINQIDVIKSSAKTQLDKLKNPPKKYKEVYDKIFTYYSDMESYVGLTKQPQGTYEQYTSKMTDLSAKLQSEYSQIKMKIQ